MVSQYTVSTHRRHARHQAEVKRGVQQRGCRRHRRVTGVRRLVAAAVGHRLERVDARVHLRAAHRVQRQGDDGGGGQRRAHAL
jgi:hypothetical protein